VIRKDLVLVDGATGNCNTQVVPGQLLQQLQAVTKKGPRVVSLEVRLGFGHKGLAEGVDRQGLGWLLGLGW
jgi:transposase